MAELKKAKIRSAAAVWFTDDVQYDTDGDAMRDPVTKEVIKVRERHDGMFAQEVELPPTEYERLLKAGDIIPADQEIKIGQPVPTPFTAPFVDAETGETVQWTDPVMGDPRPHGPGTPDHVIVSGPGVLTPEQHEELRAKAEGTSGDAEADADDAGLYDSYMELSKDELKDEAEKEGVEVEREDGRTDLEPTKEDYAKALTAHAESESDDEEGDGED